MRKVTEAHSNVILKLSLEETLFSYIIINHKENRYLSGFTRSGQLSGQQLKTVGSSNFKSLKCPNLKNDSENDWIHLPRVMYCRKDGLSRCSQAMLQSHLVIPVQVA